MRITELIEQASLVDYVAQYTDLTLVKDEWWGISPLSDKDTDPSFSIRDNMFYDFSAGCGGNVIEFIRKHDRCDFKTAVNTLRDWLGITEEVTTEPLPIVISLKQFREKKCAKKDCQRKIVDETELEQYYCKDFHFWDDEGLTADIIARYGVGYDRRGECITIPVRTNGGQCINILCRTTNEHAKELGIPKYIYRYKLGTLDFFWGWYENHTSICKKHEVILVEGSKSVMKLAAMGYDNAVAMLTSHLSEEQLRILVHEGVDVVFALDKDIDPYKDEKIKILKRYCRVFIATDRHGKLGEKDAPCDCGKDVWDEIYSERRLWK